jgi:hypothetical protein
MPFVDPALDNQRRNSISATFQQLYDTVSFGTTVAANSTAEYFQTAANTPGKAYVAGSGRLPDTMTFIISSIGCKAYYNDQTQATGLDLAVLGNTELTLTRNAGAPNFRALVSSLIFPGGANSGGTTDLPEQQIVLQQGDLFTVEIKNSEALTLSAATELQVVLSGNLLQYTS